MINYFFTIKEMFTINLPNESKFVVQVNYSYEGVDGEFSSSINNSLFNNVSESSNFVPYEELTKEIVVGWIEESLGINGIENFKDCIADQIALKKKAPITPEPQPLPFVNLI